MGMEGYQLRTHPKSASQAVIQGQQYRITVLTASLVRMEYSGNGSFEDRATQTVIDREFPVPKFQVEETTKGLVLCTEYLRLCYDHGIFSSEGLTIQVFDKKKSYGMWHYGDAVQNLFGTARTLDGADGEIDLGDGVISRNGYALIDDSASMALTKDGWVAPRPPENIDIYFFGYGHRYLECLNDFYHLCGNTPLLPRFALGNWWSRYHRYTEQEYKELVRRFEAEQIPFSVAVVDMDWHLVDDVDSRYGTGWTGYTWNKEFFPEPAAFMDWLHKHGLKVTLNVHPADGVRAYEEPYERVASAMGMNPEEGLPVEFDPANPKFMEVYLQVLHHPLEEEGVDFWWLDWQQGTNTKIPGLDPLWMLNHYHFLDSAWKGTRPMTFSRYAGVGSHRYPIGFSGDTIVSWESLQFQPYFTSTASNIGYGWWSHDIGGHMNGVRDDELMARWVQFGVFSPVNRLHSTDNAFAGKEPWKFDRITECVMQKFLRLRHALVPYLYTMNRRASRDNIPLVLPLYYQEPEREEAYAARNTYYFGSELLVAPITEKMEETARAGCVTTWIPEGIWADFFTGMVYHGGRMAQLWRGIDTLPVLMKAGAIVPMKEMHRYDNSTENPAAMEIRVFPAHAGHFVLWEDSGDTFEDLDENWAYTELTLNEVFHIGAAQGNLTVLPENRSWKIIFAGIENTPVRVTANQVQLDVAVSYCDACAGITIQIPAVSVQHEIEISFPEGITVSSGNIQQRCFKLLERAQMEYDIKAQAMEQIRRLGRDAVEPLREMALKPSVFGELCEILMA